ncbi:hypothetical protein ES332_D12G224900v1 [Gossypium tomentosum]|uniref:Uncharacterized protein n=1 Tax=Gossypium tomentosum TaxID=34277 RepID=A0A5D2IDW1_GOSTO|nr:hypothetical protein ES332_D12G224900v1 [Gossypium tomentosum]
MILMDAMNVEGMTVDVIHTILKVWQSGSSSAVLEFSSSEKKMFVISNQHKPCFQN